MKISERLTGGSLGLSVAAVLITAGVDSGYAAEPSHCDPYLPISADNPFGYRLRGDRCEGVYVQPVTSTPLIVASFGRIKLPEPLGADATLLVEWAPGGEVRLRAGSLKARTYYRMDSQQPVGSRTYRWPTGVLMALNIESSNVGVVAWKQQKIGDTVRDVYLPVTIGRPVTLPANAYELILVPGTELKEVFVGLSAVDVDGSQSRVVSSPTPLNFGFYPAGRSIRITVGPLSSPGMYLLEIGSTLPGGGAVSHELLFSHTPLR